MILPVQDVTLARACSVVRHVDKIYLDPPEDSVTSYWLDWGLVLKRDLLVASITASTELLNKKLRTAIQSSLSHLS